MKTKKFNKRLRLNKKTIADLNNKEMKDVLGGVPGSAGDCTQLYTNCYSNYPVACQCDDPNPEPTLIQCPVPTQDERVC